MARIVFLGAPGAGKGTQAHRLASELGVPHVSTGDMLRAAASSGDALGRRVRETIDAGRLVDDGTMIEVVGKRVAEPDAARGFLLDGYPRTLPQAEALEDAGLAPDVGIYIDVPEDELIRRCLHRGRADDTEETVRRRLEVYFRHTEPLKAFYEERRILRSVDGTGSPDDVYRRLLEAVGGARRK